MRPREIASSSVIEIALLARYEHPAPWYFDPVLVPYTVRDLGAGATGGDVGVSDAIAGGGLGAGLGWGSSGAGVVLDPCLALPSSVWILVPWAVTVAVSRDTCPSSVVMR